MFSRFFHSFLSWIPVKETNYLLSYNVISHSYTQPTGPSFPTSTAVAPFERRGKRSAQRVGEFNSSRIQHDRYGLAILSVLVSVRWYVHVVVKRCDLPRSILGYLWYQMVDDAWHVLSASSL